jgi:hypothetical protein
MRARVGDQVGPRHMNMCLGSSSFRTFSLIFWFSFFRSFFFHFFFGFFFISNSSKFKIQANFIAEHFSNSKHFLYLNFSSMSFFFQIWILFKEIIIGKMKKVQQYPFLGDAKGGMRKLGAAGAIPYRNGAMNRDTRPQTTYMR